MFSKKNLMFVKEIPKASPSVSEVQIGNSRHSDPYAVIRYEKKGGLNDDLSRGNERRTSA